MNTIRNSLFSVSVAWAMMALGSASVMADDVVLWNRFEAQQDPLLSEIGPAFHLANYVYDSWGEAMMAPGMFDNGLFVNHDTSEGWRNNGANFFAVDLTQTALLPEQGTIEFWFKFGYDSGVHNHAYFFQSAMTLAGHFLGSEGACDGLCLNGGWNGWDYGTFGKRFFFSVGPAGQEVSLITPEYSAAPGGVYAFEDGTLMHLAFVWNRAGIDATADTVRIYINGDIAASTTASWPVTDLVTRYLYIGSRPNTDPWDHFYNAVKGVTDNLIIRNRAVTDFSGRFTEAPWPVLYCLGDRFEPPFDTALTLRQKDRRSIPVKMVLFGETGAPMSGNDIVAPLVSVSRLESGVPFGAGNVGPVPPGLAQDGDAFRYDPSADHWILNLSARSFTTPGIYAVSAQAPEGAEYRIDTQSCVGYFERLP